MTFRISIFIFYILLCSCVSLYGEDINSQKSSPWLLAPLVSSEPKLGTSLGAMAAYLYQFDNDSPTSTFGVGGTYSTTDSYFAGIFGRLYFDHDQQRLILGLIKGRVNNEYNDFLGTGYPAETTDDVHVGFARYSYQVLEDWFFGPQVISTNYSISGDNFQTDQVLGFIGLTGFNSNGVGLFLQRDTRDNQNSPESGSTFTFHNIAYRKGLGGDVNFDVYKVELRSYFLHLKKHVLAVRLDGHWSVDAPPGGYATTDLRGYTKGQYLAPYSTSFEVEERIELTKKWGAELFAGVNYLYGDSGINDWFPSGGGGINYMIKEEEKMIVRADIAVGQSDNYGLYLQFGRAF